MARDEQMHQRLLEWAQAVTVGDGSGFPTMSVLHEDWMPPSGGITPTLKVSPQSGVRQTHRILGQFSGRLQDTIVLHYCKPALSLQTQADLLGCGISALHKRIEQAHAFLRAWVEAERRLSEAKAAKSAAMVFDSST